MVRHLTGAGYQTSSGGWVASRVNTLVQGDVVDLAARRTDIHKLPVA